MKALLVSLILIAGLSGYFFAAASKEKEKRAALIAAEARFAEEKAELQRAPRPSARPAIQPVVAPPSAAAAPAAAESPEAVMARLLAIRVPPGQAGIRAMRKVVHELENLVDAGPAAVPVIADFLAKFQDVDYQLRDEDDQAERASAQQAVPGGPVELTARETQQAESTRRGRRAETEGRGGDRGFGNLFAEALRPNRRVDLNFPLPPSLRIGLFDALREIGGPQAESALAQALATTGRPVEVAYLATMLQEMQPNVHRDSALGAAKELLLDPPAELASANRLDRDGKSYLYHVLAMYNDTSFMNLAQNIVITPDGRLDRNTFDYLRGLGAQGVPGLVQAYNDARLTNLTEKASIANTVLGYVGKDANANAMLQQVLADQTVPGRLRSMALMRLMREDDDPNLAAQRIPIVQQAKAMSPDPDIQRAADATIAGLTQIQQGERPDMREFFRGMLQESAQGAGRRPGGR